MTIRDIVVAFGFDVDRNSERNAENHINGIKNFATKVLGTIGIGFSIAGMSHLAEAAAEVEALQSQFSQVFGEMEEEAASKLAVIEADTGVMVNRMKGSFTQIAAFSKTAGVEQADALDIANRSMIAVADSAAFYDRSIEDVTNSLQSFLKGNFENDAALGLSCTETTRNTAANNLYGKSFKDLSEAEKQFTLLSMVEEANKASGALGQAARESDTWSNQLGNLRQSLQDLKATVGSAFLKPAVMVLKFLVSFVQGLTTKLQVLTSETGVVTKAFERFYALIKRLKPEIFRMSETLQKGITIVKGVIDRFGGLGNVLKLLTVIVGSFFAVLTFAKVIKGVKALAAALKEVDKMMALAKGKVLAIVAVVVILTLIIEDFFHFLMGNDSVIGSVFDKAGIGADNARQAICNIWTQVKEFLLEVWDFIKQAAGIFVDTIKRFFEKHVESIRANFERVWGIIKTFLSGVWTFLSQLATTLFGNTEDNINASTQSTKDKLLAIWQAIFDALLAVWDTLYNVGSGIFNAVATVIETIFGWIQSFWNRWGTKILAWFKGLWNSMGGVLSAFLVIMKRIANFLSSVFTGDWQGAWNAVKDICKAVWDMIVNIVTAAWETMKLIFRMALSAIQSVWEATWKGIQSFFAGVLEWIENKTGFSMDGVKAIVRNALEIMKVLFSTVFENIKAIVSAAFTIIKAVVSTAMQILQGIIQVITSAIYGDWSGVWEGIKEIVLAVWEYIKTIVTTAIHLVYTIISNVLNAIKSIVESIWTAIIILVQTGLSNIATVVMTCLTAISSAWNTVWSAVFGFFQGIWNGISSFLSGIWSTITGIISNSINNAYFVIQLVLGAIRDFFSNSFNTIASTVSEIFSNILSSISLTIGDIKDTIVNGIHTAVDFIKGLPAQAVQWGADFVGGLKEGILSGVQGIVDAVKGIGDKIKSFLHFSVPDEGPLTDYESWMPDFMGGLAAGMESSSNELLSVVAAISAQIKEPFIFAFQETEEIIRASMNHIGESVKSGLERGVAFLQSMPSQTMQWGVDLIDGFRNGILSGVDSIGNAVKSIAEQIRSYLHFSVPDVGPLTDYESWMPDFMGGLAKGIGENETLVFDRIRSLASGIAMLTQAATASAATVANHTIQNTTSNLTQNVNISNSYSGGSMETQRNVSKAMKQSAVDATDYLAKGLAYARG